MDHEDVNKLKGLAIIAVVLIHVINLYAAYTQHFVIADQILRFSVPLFTALSGLALAKKYATKLDLKDFFSRRLFKLLPLYILWSAVYWLVTRQGFPFEYHLYFVPMIFQAYLLFPIILPIVKKAPWVALSASAILQILYFQHATETSYIWFAAWQFYFVLGIFLAIRPIRHIRLIGLMTAAIGLIWSVRDTMGLLLLGKNLIFATRFTKVSVLVYSTGLTLFLSAWTKKSKILTLLGQYSYPIYLSHVLFLQLLLGGDFVLSIPIVAIIGFAAVLLSLL